MPQDAEPRGRHRVPFPDPAKLRAIPAPEPKPSFAPEGVLEARLAGGTGMTPMNLGAHRKRDPLTRSVSDLQSRLAACRL